MKYLILLIALLMPISGNADVSTTKAIKNAMATSDLAGKCEILIDQVRVAKEMKIEIVSTFVIRYWHMQKKGALKTMLINCQNVILKNRKNIKLLNKTIISESI